MNLTDFDAVIFDMDGTLLDSERPIFQAFRDTCTQRGLPPQDDVFRALVGLPLKAGTLRLRELLRGEIDFDAFIAAWDVNTDIQNGDGVPLKAGARELLDFLDNKKMPFALATSTRRARVEVKLNYVGVFSRFRAIVCGDEISNGKPAPDIFLEAARRAGVAPGRCLAVEDSTNGVRAALAAGMTTIFIPDVIDLDATLIAAGAQHVRSLTELHRALAGSIPTAQI